MYRKRPSRAKRSRTRRRTSCAELRRAFGTINHKLDIFAHKLARAKGQMDITSEQFYDGLSQLGLDILNAKDRLGV